MVFYYNNITLKKTDNWKNDKKYTHKILINGPEIFLALF